MRKLTLVFLFLICNILSPASAQELPNLPFQKEFSSKNSLEVWEKYSRNILNILFPTEQKLIKKMGIRIINNDSLVFAGTNIKEIGISTGLIMKVRDQDEYASILSHELGHRLLIHREMARPTETLDEVLNYGLSFPDWETHHRNESEADTISLLVSRNPRKSLELFLRVVVDAEIKNKGPQSEEVEKMVRRAQGLRVQTMTNIIEYVELAPIVKAKPLPNLPSFNESTEVWETYARNVLVAMYPNHRKIIDKITIRICETCKPAFSVVNTEKKIYEIDLNSKLLQDVIKTPKEFATLLGHEFGHIAIARNLDRDYLDTDVSFTENEVYDRKQFEADIFATLPLTNGECIWGKVLEKMSKSPVILEDTPDYESSWDQTRIRRLKASCALNR